MKNERNVTGGIAKFQVHIRDSSLVVFGFERNGNILTVPESKSMSCHRVWNNKNYNDRNKRTSYISR